MRASVVGTIAASWPPATRTWRGPIQEAVRNCGCPASNVAWQSRRARSHDAVGDGVIENDAASVIGNDDLTGAQLEGLGSSAVWQILPLD
jgi:hypothetical protein